jgi:S1-C subfamily serine protease
LLALTTVLASCGPAGAPHTSAPSSTATAGKINVFDNFGVPELEQRFEAVARQVSPAVVAISATEAPVESDPALTASSGNLNADKLAGMLESVDRTVGTGFIVDSDGYIVTNEHVVAKALQLWVTTDTKKVYPAIVVASDARSDLAVLKVPAHALPLVKFSKAGPRRGQWTIAVGNPYGLAVGGEMAVSVGVVSATSRSLPRLSGKEDRLYCDLIQTTAQINPGNSGGPLFDLAGDVIGINTAVILPQKQTNGIGFAIPADAHVCRLIEDLKQGREILHGYLGVSVSSATARECRDAGLDEEAGGARVEAIDNASPAAAAHFQVGDIISEIDGAPVRDTEDFVRLIGMSRAAEPVQAVIYRNGVQTVSFMLRPRPSRGLSDAQRFHWHGMLLGPIPAYWDFGTISRPSAGVMVIGVDSRSTPLPGVKAGSVITQVAGKSIHDLAEFRSVVANLPPAQCSLRVAGATDTVVSAD